jgi:hypothetical protein
MGHSNPSHRSLDVLERDRDRNRYNVAFHELGLEWHWDEHTYTELQSNRGDHSPVRVYVETRVPHLLRAYDPDFLVNAIEAKRTELDGAHG